METKPKKPKTLGKRACSVNGKTYFLLHLLAALLYIYSEIQKMTFRAAVVL